MSQAMQRVAEKVRTVSERAARRSSPHLERFKVLRIKPLLLEAYGSELKLSEDDDDFEVSRGIRRLIDKGDDVLVGTDRDGDRMIVAMASDQPDAEPAKALTAADSGPVNNEYGESEADVIRNLRTRVNELESRLKDLGFLPS